MVSGGKNVSELGVAHILLVEGFEVLWLKWFKVVGGKGPFCSLSVADLVVQNWSCAGC